MKLGREQKQLLILRIYIGVDFIHHFAEKLGLLGQHAYHNVLAYFTGLHFHNPSLMVLIAGLCEFAAFVGFTFGLFTRIAAIGSAAYLIISGTVGGHFGFGFTWANAGGGWEFPLMWAVFCLSFVYTGGGNVSLDAKLLKKLPKRLKFLSQ